MSPENKLENVNPTTSVSGLSGTSADENSAVDTSSEAEKETTATQVLHDSSRFSGPLASQERDSQGEQALNYRIKDELDQSKPRSERLQAANNLIDQMRTCSQSEVETMLEMIGDLVCVEADLTSRELGFRLLDASATCLEDPRIRGKVLNTLIIPVDHRLAYLQISALDHLVQQERDPPCLVKRVAMYLIGMLSGLFTSAEKARQRRHKGGDIFASRKNDTSKQRPEEEKALLKCLSLTTNIIKSSQKVLQANELEVLLTAVTNLASQTTGLALMRGFHQVVSACGIYASIPLPNLGESLRLLCFIMGDERYKSQEDASLTIYTILDSEMREEALDILQSFVLTKTTQPESLRRSALFAISRTFASGPRSELYSAQIRKFCDMLASESDAPSILIDPLLDLLSACDLTLNPDLFVTVLQTIKHVANLSLDRATKSNVSAHLIESLISYFLRCFLRHGSAAVLLYEMIICIANVAKSLSARLAAMKLLARLRCDASCGIRVERIPDIQSLAQSLCRTKTSAAAIRVSSSPSSQTSFREHTPPSRRTPSRNSDVLHTRRSRSSNRPTSLGDRIPSAKEPLWVYDERRKGLPTDSLPDTSATLHARSPKTKDFQQHLLDLGQWLDIMINELDTASNWELYTYVLVHLPSQLSNSSLFQDHPRQISDLHELLNTQLSSNSFPEPPLNSGIRRGDIALCLYHSLAVLLSYQDFIGVRQWNRTVSTFRAGIEKWDRVGKFCIHSLTVCCYEIPNILENHLNVIIEMMQKRITQSDLAIDIVEFLACLARLPDAYDKTDVELHQKIFGICIRYLQHAREQRKVQADDLSARASLSSNRTMDDHGDGLRHSLRGEEQRNLHEYVFTIAYQAMIFWFLAIDVRERARHVAWITRELTWKTELGMEEMEQQSMVFLDMMHRTTFSNLGETYSAPQFVNANRKVYRGSWLVGLSVITAEAVIDELTGRSECGQFTKRQASGTTHAVYYHNTEDTPSHQVPEIATSSDHSRELFDIYPNHMVLQLISTISPVPAPLQPIPLPDDDEFTKRALRLFDATDTVDGHKAAVIFVGEGQTEEQTILRNTSGSEAFEAFLSKLGYKVVLKDAKFNTQGLDRQYGTDGSHTHAWRDRVTEIVFHIPTMMPNNLQNDAACSRKKSHIGNDHVKIIFNDSGLSYNTNIFASDFNSVNIVITPEAHSHRLSLVADRSAIHSSKYEPSDTDKFGYYHVQVFTSERYPEISPAASVKVISACGLPCFVRQLALNASVFCQVWARNMGEYTSSWRFRLQQIIKLRERFANANASANIDYPQGTDTGPPSFAEGDTWNGTVTYGGLAEMNSLISNLDFTRWTK